MRRRSFNTQWRAGRAPSGFALAGTAPQLVDVTLPYDVVRDTDRSADTPNGSHTGYFAGGVFHYVKTFDAPEQWSERTVLLEFEGVYRDAVVRINGEVAARRPHGYSGFIVDVAPYLTYGQQNEITVTARSGEDSRWYTGSGIYRPVWLRTGGLVHIQPDGVSITTPDIEKDLATVEATVAVVNGTRTTRTVRVAIRLLDETGAEVALGSVPVTLLPGETAPARIRRYITDPALWGVESPTLYRAQVTISADGEELDTDEATFGIRRLQLDPVHGLRINGEHVDLRGACIHHDHGPLGSAAIARAEYRRVERLKAAGYNAIRSAHNPLSRATLDACDRLGMLVMDEYSDMWSDSKSPWDYAASFDDWWERDIEAMVAKDRNHPSVIIYSIGNEIPEVGRPVGSAMGRRLAEKVRALDSTRYVTNAVNLLVAVFDAFATSAPDSDEELDVNELLATIGERIAALSVDPQVTERTEESFGVLDIAGINYGESRYQLDHQLFPSRILVGSETFPEHLDVLWPLVQQLPTVIGDFAWTGWDYIGETGLGHQIFQDDTNKPDGVAMGFPWLLAGSGTIDITGQRRPISYWREIVWGLRTTPYLTVLRPENFGRIPVERPWAWRDSVASWSWDVPAGTPVEVEVYADADAVELLLNGEAVAHAAVGTEKPYLTRIATTYQPGELTAVAYKQDVETGRTTLRSAQGPVALKLHPDRTHIAGDDTDLAYVDIVLEDARGEPATAASAHVTLEIEGPGRLGGFGSARPDSLERFDSATRHTYDGRALAIIRPTAPGTITVRATAPGYPPATATVQADRAQTEPSTTPVA